MISQFCYIPHVRFFCFGFGTLQDLHSFPTRRSSDLVTGDCNENLVVQSMDRLTLITGNGASITDSSSGSSAVVDIRSEEHTSELQSLRHLVCRLLLEKKNNKPCSLSRTTLSAMTVTG